MRVICLSARPRTARGRVAVLGALFLMVFYAQLVLAGPAGAGALTGGFSPTVVSGGADLKRRRCRQRPRRCQRLLQRYAHHRRQARLRRLGSASERWQRRRRDY
jgi:hypothetical protein